MRSFYPDVYYFLSVPTINHYPFFRGDPEKDILLESIQIAKEKYKIKELDFCLLVNHYHLVGWFDNNQIIPQVIKQINGRSGKFLNNYHQIKNRKIWGEYHINFINHEESLYRSRGYVIGNAYKHGEVKNLSDLAHYKYSTFINYVNKTGQKAAEDMVLSSILMNDDDWQKEFK